MKKKNIQTNKQRSLKSFLHNLTKITNLVAMLISNIKMVQNILENLLMEFENRENYSIRVEWKYNVLLKTKNFIL